MDFCLAVIDCKTKVFDSVEWKLLFYRGHTHFLSIVSLLHSHNWRNRKGIVKMSLGSRFFRIHLQNIQKKWNFNDIRWTCKDWHAKLFYVMEAVHITSPLLKAATERSINTLVLISVPQNLELCSTVLLWNIGQNPVII